jgi:heterotetrameric sarcosine oxidase delta subunit
MRVACPYCGERSLDEFVDFGAAGLTRPDMSAGLSAWVSFVYLRDNPAGQHRELFYHVGGCHAWLIVTRDTRTHAITGVVGARDAHQDAAS